MTKHRGHTITRMKIVNGDRFVRTRSGQIDSRTVKYHFNERTIFANGTLEGFDVFAVANHVNTDIAVLASSQNVLMVILKNERNTIRTNT